MSAREQLTPKQRVMLAQQLGSALPAHNSLLLSLWESIRERRGMAPVLRRLLDAETEVDRLRDELAEVKAPRTGRCYLNGDVLFLSEAVIPHPITKEPHVAGWTRKTDEREWKPTAVAHEELEHNAWQDITAKEKDTSDGRQSSAGESTPALADLLRYVEAFEIPRPGNAMPLLLERSYAGGDRWSIGDREGRRWDREHGFVLERQDLDEKTRTDTRFPLAEAWPLAHRVAAGEAGP
ncbi:hypothetical protein ABZU94_10540 [Streptomyces mirabilis]|uniref:hypothetical protein n=1 Tax=Streptomyces sp. NPDC005388 TaxID=3156717 RepID=UPI0033B6224C